jgi:hypothetical protein
MPPVSKFKKGQISAARAYEVADSLMNNSVRKKSFAADQRSIGKATIKNGVADKQVNVGTSDPRTWGKTLSGNDRIKIADKLTKEASADSSNSVRIKGIADAAMTKANQAKAASETKGFSYKLKSK